MLYSVFQVFLALRFYFDLRAAWSKGWGYEEAHQSICLPLALHLRYHRGNLLCPCAHIHVD